MIQKTNTSMETYQMLVQELLKDHPDEKKIQLWMEALDMKYSNKNIDRLTEVLAFNPNTRNEKRMTHDL